MAQYCVPSLCNRASQTNRSVQSLPVKQTSFLAHLAFVLVTSVLWHVLQDSDLFLGCEVDDFDSLTISQVMI